MRRVFLDTNVIAYAFDRRDADKQALALQLLSPDAALDRVVSTQVMVELVAVLGHGLPEPVALPVITELLAVFDALTVVPTDHQLVRAGLAEAERWGFSHWDGLIVAAARQARVEVLLTEDLQHGQDLDGLLVQDPFIDE